jgi:hypothetical protein
VWANTSYDLGLTACQIASPYLCCTSVSHALNLKSYLYPALPNQAVGCMRAKLKATWP